MTKARARLPATPTEAEALEFARQYAAPYRCGGSPWSATPMTSTGATHGVFRTVMENMLKDPYGRMRLVDAAQVGYAMPAEILRAALVTCKSQEIAMPLELKAYDLWRTANEGRIPKQRHTGNMDDLTRDIVVCMTVGAVYFHFPSLHLSGQSARRRSIFEIVAEVFNLSYSNVRRVWRLYGHAIVAGMPPEGQKLLFEIS